MGFGDCAHRVDETTAVVRIGWRDRLILVTGQNTRFIRVCLEIHDLAIAKYAAGRERDLDFNKVLARHTMVNRAVLEHSLNATSLDSRTRDEIAKRIQRISAYQATAPEMVAKTGRPQTVSFTPTMQLEGAPGSRSGSERRRPW